ncbi:hypothetical protein [Micromonospora sp. WMMA1947]|uniref:hypothetical protein n=1 Tax=Micromonospora sp. WMMA1947 TaxID=3015163 RepID=UPI00248C04C3|nr:hypothetical protein [Micromonospora sp. WMMA1947]WBC06775.1 hypothetical protein O7604_16115 [Micromonospora sp. WMMA1947]
MTTAEKITIGVSIASALGIGALIKSIFDRRISRPERRMDLAEKSLKLADAIVARVEAELAQVQRELTDAKQENEQLRKQAAEALTTRDQALASATVDRLDRTADHLASAATKVAGIRIELKNYNSLIIPASEGEDSDFDNLRLLKDSYRYQGKQSDYRREDHR